MKHQNVNIYEEDNINKLFILIMRINEYIPNSFKRYKAIMRNTGVKVQYSKSFRISENVDDLFLKELKERKYQSIIFYNESLLNDPSNYLELNIDKDDILEKSVYRLEFSSENAGNISNSLLSIFITDMIDFIDLIYGFIVISNKDYTSFQSQLTWLPITKWDPKAGFNETKLEKELTFYQENINKLDKYIAKAHWGNFLNRNHVSHLGGVQKIMQEAPAYLVREIAKGGVYIQLTKSWKDLTEKDLVKKVKELDNYFRPIILPARPEVSWEF